MLDIPKLAYDDHIHHIYDPISKCFKIVQKCRPFDIMAPAENYLECDKLLFMGKPCNLIYNLTYRELADKFKNSEGIFYVDCMLFIQFELVNRFNLWDKPARLCLADMATGEFLQICYDNNLSCSHLFHKEICRKEEDRLSFISGHWLIHNKEKDTYTGINNTGVHEMTLSEWRESLIAEIKESYDEHGLMSEEYPGYDTDPSQWWVSRIQFQMIDGKLESTTIFESC